MLVTANQSVFPYWKFMTSVSFMAANAKYCLLLDSKQSFCAASGSNNETVKHIEQLQQAWFQHICQRNNSTFSKYLDSVLLREFVSAFQEARKLMKDIGGMTKNCCLFYFSEQNELCMSHLWCNVHISVSVLCELTVAVLVSCLSSCIVM